MTPRPSPAAPGHGWTLLIRYGTPCLIYAAGAPFGLGVAASVWLAVVFSLLTARHRAEKVGREAVRSAAEGLLGLAYALAALSLLETGNTAAEVLATTMLGVGLFATLIRDYRDSRRLVLNTTPYLTVIVIMQAGAIQTTLQHGRADLVVTIVAAPLLVGNIFMILHRDLRAAHRKLASSLVDAQAVARAKADFLANMSHEIRTPLNAVLGYADLLEGGAELAGRDLSYVRAIKVGGADLLAVVNDILDASRLEAGKMTLSPRPTAAVDFLRDSVGLFEPLAAAKSVRLKLELVNSLPERLVVDDARLRQVLSNLIGNALRFTPVGEVVVRASYAAPQLSVEVRDTGIGIAPDDLDRLFVRFTQAASPSGHRSSGSGLGLSIAKDLIELMGGELSAASTLGAGSTFRVRLPAAPAEAPADQELGPISSSLAGAHLRILVVDDHAANRTLIRAVLQSSGHVVQDASDGAEAIRVAETHRFDLILMDLHMPGLDGYATTTAIRNAGGANNRTPIVAVSADVLPEHVRRCMDAGLSDHLPKPISPAALLEMVGKWGWPAGDAEHMGRLKPLAA